MFTENRLKGKLFFLCSRGSVFRTLSNIYDGVFFRKQIAAFSRYLFLQKSSIIDV